jgi:anti-sigma factor RsiW
MRCAAFHSWVAVYANGEVHVTCKDVADFLDAYLVGELPALRKLIFDAHIALCKDCRNYIAGYKKAGDLARQTLRNSTDEPPLPQELVQAIMRAKDH